MAILLKAFISQLFGSPDIHLLEYDPASGGGIEGLREEISNLVGGRDVSLAWLDADGDRIRLSTDQQLDFAVKYGVKENALRVSVKVDWLGPDAAAKRARQLAEERLAAAEAEAEAEAQGGDEAAAEAGEKADDEGTNGDGSEEAAAKVGDAPAKRCRHGKGRYSGYVRTVDENGVAHERNLSEKEAAYLLHRDAGLFGFDHSPLSLGGSLFSQPRLQYRSAAPSPLYLLW